MYDLQTPGPLVHDHRHPTSLRGRGTFRQARGMGETSTSSRSTGTSIRSSRSSSLSVACPGWASRHRTRIAFSRVLGSTSLRTRRRRRTANFRPAPIAVLPRGACQPSEKRRPRTTVMSGNCSWCSKPMRTAGKWRAVRRCLGVTVRDGRGTKRSTTSERRSEATWRACTSTPPRRPPRPSFRSSRCECKSGNDFLSSQETSSSRRSPGSDSRSIAWKAVT